MLAVENVWLIYYGAYEDYTCLVQIIVHVTRRTLRHEHSTSRVPIACYFCSAVYNSAGHDC